ncbi:MAG: hypothetical protein H6582_00470 [Crocinitomicaceae bacterium]|nr:hypothetical protein [Crocinitomicaceae bacterium]
MKKALFLVLITFGLQSCGFIAGGMAKKKCTVEKGVIPAEFGKTVETLVILYTDNATYNKYVEKKVVKKAYTGPYDMCYDITKSKYEDKKLYRYFISYGLKENIDYNANLNEFSSYNVKKFFLVDRVDGKVYTCPITSSFWGAVLKSYLKNLDKERIANQG